MLSPEKYHLEPYVVQHHLISVQAAALCSQLGEAIMAGQGRNAEEVVEQIRAEKEAAIAEIEARYAAKEAAAAAVKLSAK